MKMAMKATYNKSTNYAGIPGGWRRGGSYSLDPTEVFFSLETAQNYAQNDLTAYHGQKIVVIDETNRTVTHYSIEIDGTLKELGAKPVGDDLSIEVNGSTVSLKNWSKKYYKYVAAVLNDDGSVKTPATYELTDGFIDGLEVKVRKTTKTDDSGSATTVYELAYYEPNPTTVEGLQSALTGVQAQAADAKNAATAADTKATQAHLTILAGDKIVKVVDATNEDGTRKSTVSIKLDNSGNVKFTETNDGLKADVTIPAQAEYSIKKLDTATNGASASYRLTKDGTEVGAVIDIPKDMVVSSGTVETKTESGDWGDAGTYIVLTLANATSDKLYINVGSLIEYVTSGSQTGDMVFVTVDALTHKITATITDGTVTKAKLHSDVQALLDKAGTALQSVSFTILGKNIENNGEITVDEVKTALGLNAEGIAAYKQVSELESTMDTKIQDALNWSSI